MNDRNSNDKKKKKSNYKAKRSFTRNKKLRTDEPEKFGRGKKDFSGKGESAGDKPRKFNKGFDKDKRDLNKEKRAGRKEQFERAGKRSFSGDRKTDSHWDKEKKGGFKKEKSFGRDEHKTFRKKEHDGDKPWDKEKKGDFKREKSFDRDEHKAYPRKNNDDAKPWDKEKRGDFKKEKSFDRGERRTYPKKDHDGGKPWDKEKKSDFKKEKSFDGDERKTYPRKDNDGKRPFKKGPSKKASAETFAQKGLIRLNRYIANAGICSRREADDLITTGCISVNGKIITELGYKVKDGDEVNYSGQRLKTEKHVYVLLNKPKDYLTTAEDDRGRRTVMELIAGACKERVYPVGRLDRNTMGLLLFTNDGEMTKKLTHPKHLVQKLYHVELDKNLKQDDLNKIQNGLELEDGFIKPDEVSYAGESKREVGILIHSGRNRIVRRIFEQLGYDILKLDRIMFAGLTKKDLPRGRWRLLTEKEIAFLKMI